MNTISSLGTSVLPFRAILFILCLLPFSALAGQEAPAAAPPLACAKLFPAGSSLSPITTERPRSLIEPARNARPVPEEETVRIEETKDLVALTFRTRTVFTPWLGAGLDLESGAESPSAYNLGAGFGCELDRTTRLSIGYRYSSLLGILSDPTTPADEERHHFAVGLQKSF